MMKKYLSLFFGLILSTCALSQELLCQKQIRIPVVNLEDYYDENKKEAFLETLYEAMTTIGFFGVQKTGISENLLSDSYQHSINFFKLDDASKQALFFPHLHGQRGFVKSETAKNTLQKDMKEFFHIGSKTHLQTNLWPKIEGFQMTMEALFEELYKHSVPLQEAIVDVINKKANASLSKHLITNLTLDGDTVMRLIYYPALREKPSQTNPERFWAAPHTDINLITILPFATEKGLQVLVNDRWLNVVVPKDTFVVNVGDMLQNLSNGLFKSSRHRVLAQDADKERFSIVMFVHPHSKAALDPLEECIKLTGNKQLYACGIQQEFLWERLLELGIGGDNLAKIYSETGHFERQLEYHRESPQVMNLLKTRGLLSKKTLDLLPRD